MWVYIYVNLIHLQKPIGDFIASSRIGCMIRDLQGLLFEDRKGARSLALACHFRCQSATNFNIGSGATNTVAPPKLGGLGDCSLCHGWHSIC